MPVFVHCANACLVFCARPHINSSVHSVQTIEHVIALQKLPEMLSRKSMAHSELLVGIDLLLLGLQHSKLLSPPGKGSNTRQKEAHDHRFERCSSTILVGRGGKKLEPKTGQSLKKTNMK